MRGNFALGHLDDRQDTEEFTELSIDSQKEYNGPVRSSKKKKYCIHGPMRVSQKSQKSQMPAQRGPQLSFNNLNAFPVQRLTYELPNLTKIKNE